MALKFKVSFSVIYFSEILYQIHAYVGGLFFEEKCILEAINFDQMPIGKPLYSIFLHEFLRPKHIVRLNCFR